MPVLTRKEFEKIKKSPPKKVSIKEDPIPELTEEETLFEYVFFYPENRLSGYHNGTYRVTIDGTVREHSIIDGIVKVQSIREREALLNEGFIFLRRQEVKE